MWFSTLFKKGRMSYGKNLPTQTSAKPNTTSIRGNLKPIPQREKVKPEPEPEPKTTCVIEFNKIVDYILLEINRIESSSSPLWNTQTDKGPNKLTSFDIGHDNHFMTWTYYFRDAKEYHGTDNYYDSTLINSEHICWHAENEKQTCANLKRLSKASVKVTRETREVFSDPRPQLEYGMQLSTFDWMDDITEDGAGSIQMQTDCIDIKENPYIQEWTDEDKAKYIPAIVRVLKEHDALYKKIIQMSKDAVRILEL